MARPEFDEQPSTGGNDDSHDEGGNLGLTYNTPLDPPEHK